MVYYGLVGAVSGENQVNGNVRETHSDQNIPQNSLVEICMKIKRRCKNHRLENNRTIYTRDQRPVTP